MSLVSRRSYRSKRTLMSDMNVTPMIDVMLVLLVIFMVTAPLLTVGVKVSLPSANAPSVESQEIPIVVHINSEGRIFIGDVEVDAETLPEKLKAIAGETDAKIFVRGDKTLPYGVIMQTMGLISSSGFKKVILVTELPKKQRENVSAKQR